MQTGPCLGTIQNVLKRSPLECVALFCILQRLSQMNGVGFICIFACVFMRVLVFLWVCKCVCICGTGREEGMGRRERRGKRGGAAEDNNQCHLQEFHLSPVWRQGFTLASKLQRSTSTEIQSIYHWLEFVCDFWGWNLQLEGMGFNYLAISNESWKKTSLSYQFSSEMVIYKAPNMMHSEDPMKGQWMGDTALPDLSLLAICS